VVQIEECRPISKTKSWTVVGKTGADQDVAGV
jgi:ribosomal protein S17